MEALCQTYWQPVRRYLVALGCREQDAADVTQEFFAAFIRGGGFTSAAPEAGRLRTLMKKSAQFHLFSHWRKTTALKRGGPQASAASPADELDAPVSEPQATAATDAAYDRDWALTVLDGALRRLEESYAQRGRGALFAVIKDGLLRPGGLRDDAAAAGALGISAAQVRVAVHRARQRLGNHLREAIAATTDPGEVEDEVRHLMGVLIQAGA